MHGGEYRDCSDDEIARFKVDHARHLETRKKVEWNGEFAILLIFCLSQRVCRAADAQRTARRGDP